tara:strand:- start:40073 stop:41173 length:1101 start_codon:yes stop_codon:yes gene_type:complete
MSTDKVIYFSKMFQAVPHLAQVASELDGVFVSTRHSTLKAARSHYRELNTARYSRYFGALSRGNRLLSSADVIVTGSPYKGFLESYDAKKCTVFHGTYMMLSRHALQQNAHFDLLCVIGPRMKTMIERFSFGTDLHTVDTGFLPFCEYPDRNALHRTQVLASLGLSASNQTVVYTSSRRGFGSWQRAAAQLLKTAPAHFNLILRPHPSQALTSRRRDRESFREIQQLMDLRGNAFLDLSSRALSEVLSVADLVVSDANSPSEEALFYDIPQLFIETSECSKAVIHEIGVKEEMHPDDLGRLLTLYDCGPNLTIDDALPDFSAILDRAIADAHVYAAQRQNYFSWVFGSRDRMAHQRVAKAIKTYLL